MWELYDKQILVQESTVDQISKERAKTVNLLPNLFWNQVADILYRNDDVSR